MKLAGLVAAQLKDRLLDEVTPQLQAIEERLGLVEQRVDRIQLLHLQEGLQRLSEGKRAAAGRELNYAAKVDDAGAVARFWLSFVQHASRQRRQAASTLAEALAINPYVGAHSQTILRVARSMPSAREPLLTSAQWRRRFPADLHSTVPKRPGLARMWDFLELIEGKPVARINSVTVGEPHVAVAWSYGRGNVEQQDLLSVLDLETGRCRWTKRLDGTLQHASLIFAGQRFIAVGRANAICLLDSRRGNLAHRFSAHYFASAVAPGYPRRDHPLGYAGAMWSASARKPTKTGVYEDGNRWTVGGALTGDLCELNVSTLWSEYTFGSPHGHSSSGVKGEGELSRVR